MQQITAPRGTRDILPSDINRWHYVENIVRELCRDYGYGEIRIPVFEHTELFTRGVGDTTDIVQKEMYTFEDKGGRSLTLRPEGTAGVVRAYLEHSMGANGKPVKMYYLNACYRYEKPAAGRYREYNTFGVENIGSSGANADVEVICLALAFLDKCGVRDYSLHINSIGCPTCRKDYSKTVREYFEQHKDKLCKICHDRLAKNPMRIIDCKESGCKVIAKDAPKILHKQCETCAAHFAKVTKLLDSLGVNYVVDENIVRGLDYYSTTVFEVIKEIDGVESVLLGGGRYDYLVDELGGEHTPSCGFGLGIERVLIAMKQDGIEIAPAPTPALFIAAIGDNAVIKAEQLVYNLRKASIFAERDTNSRSIKAQMKYANKIGAAYTIVLGDSEIESGIAKLKQMESGNETEIALDISSIIQAIRSDK